MQPRYISIGAQANGRGSGTPDGHPGRTGWQVRDLYRGRQQRSGGAERAQLAVVSVGDSRAYLFRDGQLSQLTHDHSVVQELIDSGQLAPDQWRTHPERSLLTRALGVAPVVDLDLSRPALAGGARLLLCTDGLTAQADETEIAGVLSAFADPDRAAVELVRLANRNGGADNTAVVVVDISPQQAC